MPMTFREYQIAARRTSGRNDVVYCPSPFAPLPLPRDPALITRLRTAGLGLVGEWGELCDLYKKVVGHGHAMDRDKFVKEAGDVAWYVAEMHTCLGIEFGAHLDFIDVDEYQSECMVGTVPVDHGIRAISGHDVSSDIVHALLFGVKYVSVLTETVALILDGSFGESDTTLTTVQNLNATVGQLCVVLGCLEIKLSEVLDTNIAKLKERYPEGFSSERSVNRTDP